MSRTTDDAGPAGLAGAADRLGRALAGGTGTREPGPEAPLTPQQSQRNLLKLALGALLIVAIAVALHGLVPLLVIVALFSFVMLHEAGHLLTAKLSGMKVTEYFVGFGPRLWSVRKGETEYGVKAIPAGGYVRIVGMNNLDRIDPADEPRSYREQSFPRRLIVALAGSTVHFLIALILLFSLNQFVGVTNFNRPLLRVDSVEALSTGPSPAQQAGFEHGDVIERADGQTFAGFDDLRTYIQNNPGKAITFDVRRGTSHLTLVATPVDLTKVQPKDSAPTTAPTKPTGFLGIAPAFAKEHAPNPAVAVGRSFTQLGRDMWLTLRAIGSIFSPHGITSIGNQVFGSANAAKPSASDVRPVSAVGIVHVADQAAKQGAEPLLTMLMVINVFVGVFNLIPLPPFDGGLVAVAIYERIRSRRGQRYHVDMARMLPVAYAVFAVLIFIFVSSLYLDITRPL